MAYPQKENGYTAIANEIMEALAKIRIPGEARQMLDVIIRKTYGYNKKFDMISTSQFMQLTGLKRFIIHRARKRLLLAKLITISKNDNSQILTYSFQKNYEKWIPLAKKLTVCKKVLDSMQKSAQTVSFFARDNMYKRKKDNIQKIVSGKKPDFEAPILYLNEKTKSNFDSKNKGNQGLVRARHNEGRTLEQFKAVIDKKAAQWLTDEKMAKYLRPSTLFSRTNFENYLNEPVKQQSYADLKKEVGLK